MHYELFSFDLFLKSISSSAILIRHIKSTFKYFIFHFFIYFTWTQTDFFRDRKEIFCELKMNFNFLSLIWLNRPKEYNFLISKQNETFFPSRMPSLYLHFIKHHIKE